MSNDSTLVYSVGPDPDHDKSLFCDNCEEKGFMR